MWNRSLSPETLGLQLLSHIVATAMVYYHVLTYLALSSHSASLAGEQTFEAEKTQGDIPCTNLRDRRCPMCVRMGLDCPIHGIPRPVAEDNNFHQASFVSAVGHIQPIMTVSAFSPNATTTNHTPIENYSCPTLHDPQDWLCCQWSNRNSSMAVRCIYCPHGRCGKCIESEKTRSKSDVIPSLMAAAKINGLGHQYLSVEDLSVYKSLPLDQMHISEFPTLNNGHDWRCCHCFTKNSGDFACCVICDPCPCDHCWAGESLGNISEVGRLSAATASKYGPTTTSSASPISWDIVIIAHSLAKEDLPKAAIPDPRYFQCCSCEAVNERSNRHCGLCPHVRCSRCSDVQLSLINITARTIPNGVGCDAAQRVDQEALTITERFNGSTKVHQHDFTSISVSRTGGPTACLLKPIWGCCQCGMVNKGARWSCDFCPHNRCDACPAV